MSEPHNEEQEIDVQRLNNWLDFFSLQKYHFHTSGHANTTDLESIVRGVNPKRLIPIHTKEPALFKGLPVNTTTVQLGQKMILQT